MPLRPSVPPASVAKQYFAALITLDDQRQLIASPGKTFVVTDERGDPIIFNQTEYQRLVRGAPEDLHLQTTGIGLPERSYRVLITYRPSEDEEDECHCQK